MMPYVQQMNGASPRYSSGFRFAQQGTTPHAFGGAGYEKLKLVSKKKNSL
jgi:hypothetical protein